MTTQHNIAAVAAMESSGALARAADGLRSRRVLLAATNVFVWYDYYTFIILSILVFPKILYPQFDIVAGALAAFASYIVGYVARPLGAIAMGHFGMKRGALWSARTCQIALGLSTTGIAFIPSHSHAGLWAPALLCLLRLAQGFAVGGQWGASVIVALEGSDDTNRGRAGALVQIGVPGGLLLACAASWATHS